MTIIIISATLLLIAYLFEITAHRVKSPSVILMLLLGWCMQQIIHLFHVEIPDLNVILPIFGTVGLILIVLEGALELEVTREKTALIKKSLLAALGPMLLLMFAMGFAFYKAGHGSFQDSLANAIPLCVISSAIAIPSVRFLPASKKEFVVFESSLSDILGVMLFNFVALNHEISFESVELFLAQILIILAVTVISTIGIGYLMTRIRYHIKYIPILLIIILVYALSKLIHLPGLVFVLVSGMVLGNIRQIPLKQKWKRWMHTSLLSENITRFKEITVEFTFLVRVIFFVTFGFLIKTEEVINPDTIGWAVGIVTAIYLFRALFLRLFQMPLLPLVYIAPRGLITILLFYLIPETSRIPIVNKSLIIQVILLTVLVMMAGVLFSQGGKQKEPERESVEPKGFIA
ncbi:MAG: hypothetical protein ACO25B_10310 [Chitinophagaceae bacterium]